MKLLICLFMLFTSSSVDSVNNINTFNEIEEKTFITKNTPVFFDLEMLNIPISMFQQGVQSEEQSVIASFFYDNYLLIYLWHTPFAIPQIHSLDQVLVNATSMNGNGLNVFQMGNANGNLSVAKYCELLEISVIALDLTNDLFDYSEKWLFEIMHLRFNDIQFISALDSPFTTTFLRGVNEEGEIYYDFEIQEITMLLNIYDVYRVNIRENATGWNWGTTRYVDAFFWNFNAPVPIDNIHSAVFNFYVHEYRCSWILGIRIENHLLRSRYRHTNVGITPGVSTHPLIDLEFEHFMTGVEREYFLASVYRGGSFSRDYDWSVLIYVSELWENSFLGGRTRYRYNLVYTEMIELTFETNGRMYVANVDLENGPVYRPRDIYLWSRYGTLSIWFVAIIWLIPLFFLSLIPVIGIRIGLILWTLNILSVLLS